MEHLERDVCYKIVSSGIVPGSPLIWVCWVLHSNTGNTFRGMFLLRLYALQSTAGFTLRWVFLMGLCAVEHCCDSPEKGVYYRVACSLEHC